MNKFIHGAAVLALAVGVSGQAVAQSRATQGPANSTSDYPAGTTNVQVPASCGPTDIAAVRSDLDSVNNETARSRISVLLQQATEQYQDGNRADCAQILADARAEIISNGGKVSDISAAAGGGVVPPAGTSPTGGVGGGGAVSGATGSMAQPNSGGTSAVGPGAAGLPGAATGAANRSQTPSGMAGPAPGTEGPIPQRYTTNDCQPTTWAAFQNHLDQIASNRQGEAQQLLTQIQQEFNSDNKGRCAQYMNQFAALVPGGIPPR